MLSLNLPTLISHKFLNLSELQFAHLKNGYNNNGSIGLPDSRKLCVKWPAFWFTLSAALPAEGYSQMRRLHPKTAQL